MCNIPSGPVFSEEANVLMTDMSLLGVKTRYFLIIFQSLKFLLGWENKILLEVKMLGKIIKLLHW